MFDKEESFSRIMPKLNGAMHNFVNILANDLLAFQIFT